MSLFIRGGGCNSTFRIQRIAQQSFIQAPLHRRPRACRLRRPWSYFGETPLLARNLFLQSVDTQGKAVLISAVADSVRYALDAEW